MKKVFVKNEGLTKLLLIASWFGLLTSLTEILFLGIKKFLLHRIIQLSPHVVWMTPLANLIIFLIIGLVFFLIAHCWKRFASLRIAVFTFTFLIFMSLLLMYKSLHQYAALLLAIGLAVQTTRFVSKRMQGFCILVRRSMIYMGAFSLCMMVGFFVWQELSERHALADLPSISPGAPNVLLIVLDTVRAQNLSLYGYTRATTPQMEKLAKSSMLFERAISPSPWTLPSHGSILTGRFPHELSADWLTPLDNTHPTLAEVLKANGYFTAGFVANTIYCSYEHGLNRGFIHYEDYLISPGQIILSSSLGRTITNNNTLRRIFGYYDILGRKTAERLNSDFIRWLSHNRQRPFFAFLNYFDAHEPYLPPKPFNQKFGIQMPKRISSIIHRTNSGERPDKWKMAPQEIQGEIDAYDNSIAYLDYHIGLLINELKMRGILENTLVIITSDHGEEFGEHKVFSHGNSLYLAALHVPLLVLFPSSMTEHKKVSSPVSIRDLPFAVADFLKLMNRSAFSEHSQGNTTIVLGSGTMPTGALLSEVSAGTGVPEWYPTAKGEIKSLVLDGKHYIKNVDGSEELYHWETDPWEKQNLANSEGDSQDLIKFRLSLQWILKKELRK